MNKMYTYDGEYYSHYSIAEIVITK